MKRREDQPTGPLQAKEAAINLTCHPSASWRVYFYAVTQVRS